MIIEFPKNELSDEDKHKMLVDYANLSERFNAEQHKSFWRSQKESNTLLWQHFGEQIA